MKSQIGGQVAGCYEKAPVTVCVRAPSRLHVLLKYPSHRRTGALLEKDVLVLLDETACCANYENCHINNK